VTFTLDIDTGLLTNGPLFSSSTTIAAPLNSNVPVLVQLVSQGLPANPNGVTYVSLIIKRVNNFTGPIVAQLMGMAQVMADGAAVLGLFAGGLLISSDALTADFATGIPSIIYSCQLAWANGAQAPTLCEPFAITILNSLFQVGGSEAPSLTFAGPLWFSAITGLIGGGATNLDGLATVPLPVGTRADFTINGGLRSFMLEAGAAAANEISPVDYNAETNNKKWVSIA